MKFHRYNPCVTWGLITLFVLFGCNQDETDTDLDEQIIEDDVPTEINISDYYGVDPDVYNGPLAAGSGCRVSHYRKIGFRGGKEVLYIYDSLGRISEIQGTNPKTFEYDSLGRHMTYIEFNDEVLEGVIYNEDTIRVLELNNFHFEVPTIVDLYLHWEFDEDGLPGYSEGLGAGQVWLFLSKKSYKHGNLSAEENQRGIASWHNKKYQYDTLLSFPFPEPGPFVDRKNAYLVTESDGTIYNTISAFYYRSEEDKIVADVTVFEEALGGDEPTRIIGQEIYEIYFDCAQ